MILSIDYFRITFDTISQCLVQVTHSMWSMSLNAPDSDVYWLKSIMEKELDLRPPSLVNIGKNSVFIRDKLGNPIGHLTLSNRWKGYEINSFVVDENHRGSGLSHQLLKTIESGPLFCYTRDSRLQSALLKAGYSRALLPGFIATFNLILTRLAMTSWMIATLDFRRLFHQIKHFSKYKLYILNHHKNEN